MQRPGAFYLVVSSTNSVSLQIVTANEYGPLAGFLSRFPGETRTEESWAKRLRWWWEQNPAFENGMPRGWILTRSDRIVGFYGVIPTRMQLHGMDKIALNATTWRVYADSRSESLRLMHQAMAFERGSILFSSTPNERVQKILKAYRFHSLPHTWNPQKSVLLTRPREILKSKVGSIASWLGAPVLSAAQRSRLKLNRNPSGLRVRELGRADSSFDDLWSRTRRRFPHTNIRTGDILNWHCFGNDDFAKSLFGCFDGDRLAGYVIAMMRRRGGLTLLRCLDLWAASEDPSTLAALLRFLHSWAGRNACDLVEIPHYTPDLARNLGALGLLQRRAAGEENGYYALPEEDAGELTASECYFVGLQGDLGL